MRMAGVIGSLHLELTGVDRFIPLITYPNSGISLILGSAKPLAIWWKLIAAR